MHYFFILLILLLSGYSHADESSTISHAIAMHGTAKYPPNFTQFDYTSPKALKGGTLRKGLQGNFDSLNPFISKGTSGDEIGLIYETLMIDSADEAFTQYGLIAEKIEVPKDRSWVIFHMRKEAQFHDGHSITAEDVVYSFNLLMEKGSPFYRSYYGAVSSVEALDTHKVKFTFGNEINQELALIVGQIPVLPQHYWESRDFSLSSLEIPLGSGPYKIISAEPGRRIIYERVKDYWGANLPVNKGKYNFDIIQLDYYKDSVVLLEALKANKYDFRVENSSKQWATGYDSPVVESGLIKKEMIKHENPSGMQCFLMNLRRDKFKDIRVRKAISYAFDFEWSNKNLFYGLYHRTNSYFENSELASTGLPQGRELEILQPYKNQLPESVFSTPFTLPKSDGKGYNRKNLKVAAALLKEAGWIIKDNQLVNAITNEPFIIEMAIYSPATERIVNPYSQSLKKLGIKMTVKNVEISQFVNRMRVFDYDMVTTVYGQSLSPGNEQREYWHSSSSYIDGSRNYSGINNPVVDDLVDLVISAPNRQELIYRTRALDRVLLNNHFVVPQFHSSAHRIAYWDKFSRPEISPKYDPVYNKGLMTWWIDPAKQKTINQSTAVKE